MLNSNIGPYFPLEFRWLGYILLLVSIFYLFQGNWILPLLGLLLGMCLSWSRKGVRLDMDQRKSKEYFGLLGIEAGKWQDLPALEKILLTRSNYSRVLGSKGSSSKFRFTKFRALLVGAEEHKLPFAVGKSLEQIQPPARIISEKLNIPILDCTVNPPAWVKL